MSELCISISGHFKDKDLNLDGFMDALKSELLAQEHCEVVSISKTSIRSKENLPITTQNMQINSRKNN